jgi:peptidyl-prolyl cis-trans isomerase C
MKRLPTLLTAALGAVWLSGCSGQKKPEPGYEADIRKATGFFQPGPAPAAAADPREVVLTVAGRPITRGRLVEESLQLAAALGLPPDRLAKEKDRLLAEAERALIGRTLLDLEAEKDPAPVPSSDIAGQLEKIRGSLPPGVSLEDFLQRQNTTLDQLTDRIRADLRRERYVESLTREVPAPTDEAVGAFFKENQERLARPETASGLHIVKFGPAGGKAEALKPVIDAMEALRLRALEPNTDFELLATEHTQQRGRDGKPQTRAAFPRGGTPPIFEREVFKLSPGQVSEVLVLENQVHLFKCLEIQPAQPATLEAAAPRIREMLARQAKEKVLEGKLAALRQAAEITRPGQKEAPAAGSGDPPSGAEAAGATGGG